MFNINLDQTLLFQAVNLSLLGGIGFLALLFFLRQMQIRGKLEKIMEILQSDRSE